MTLAPYPKYRTTGIEWLGEIPEHWEVKRLRVSSARPIGGIWGRDPDGRDDVVCVRVADFVRDSLSIVDCPPTIRAVEPGARTGRLLRRGDLLIEKSGGGEKQVVGAVVMFDSNTEAVCSNFIARLPMAHGFSSEFCLYAHAAAYRSRLTVPSIKQTTGIQNLDLASYLNLRWCFPPYREQCEIGSYLDRETAKLDAFVRKQQTLIERLREKRSALITETVTRGLPPDAACAAGLNPNPPRKPSGVEWLGDIPAHWALRRSDAALTRVRRQIDRRDFRDQEVMHYSIPSVQETGTGAVEPGESIESGKQVVAGPVVLVSRLNPRKATVCCAEPHPTLLTIASIEFVALRPTSTVLRFLFYLHQTEFVRQRLHAGVRSVTRSHQRVEADSVYRFWHAWPPTEEQQAIADYLDRETAKLDALVEKIETAIERLREYRSALIAAAVTGKVDVRSARQPTPAEEGPAGEALRS